MDGFEKREDTVIEEKSYSEDMWLERRNKIFKINSVIWLVVGILEFIIGLRFLLLLLAANPDNAFAEFIYNLSEVFVWPFLGLFEAPTADGSVLEFSSLVAMLIYLALGWGITKAVEIAMTPSEAREMRTLHRR